MADLKTTVLGIEASPEFEKERAKREEALARKVQQRRERLEEIRAIIIEKSDWALCSASVEPEEKADLQKKREGLDETLLLLDKLLSVSPLARQADILYIAEKLLMSGVALWKFIPPSKQVMRHYKERAHTAQMRAAKAKKREEKEKVLIQSICNRIDGECLDKPWSLAGRRLKVINADLARQGHEPVSQDAVYRRIKEYKAYLESRALEERGKTDPRS